MRLLTWDDITEVTFALFHQLSHVFVLKDARVRFESLDFLCPVDEVVLIEALDGEVH